jgi:N-acyl-D-aspartate/D-glutamate deacylase
MSFLPHRVDVAIVLDPDATLAGCAMSRMVVRGGTLVDGTGAPARTADLLIQDGLVTEVGRVGVPAGAEVVDADGLVVTPGWVDAHTHYDGQVFWDPLVTPSSWHGATTVVMGNCGVGFAPVCAGAENALMELMTKIEDIPTDTLRAGLPWGWQSYGDYLDALDRSPLAVDVGAFVPHGAVRISVMGQRAEREPATADELAAIVRLVDDALVAGALGCSLNRTMRKGAVVPGSFAPEEELFAIARVVGARRGLLQTSPAGFVGQEAGTSWEYEFDLMRRQSSAGSCPLTFPLSQDHNAPERWRVIVDRVAEANAEGAHLVPQVHGRPLNAVFTLSAHHPFERLPVYRDLLTGAASLPEKLVRLSNPAIREKILAEAREVLGASTLFRSLYRVSNPPDYEPAANTSIAATAVQVGRSPVDVCFDALLEDDGQRMLLCYPANYAYGTADVVLEMIEHPTTIVGQGDGGAHCLTLCDSTAPTTILTAWVRDRDRKRLDLETAVHELSQRPAEALRLTDRGTLVPGKRADVNLIDFEHLAAGALEYVHDLPGGNRRLIQHADGYIATFVAGQRILDDGHDTGHRPGRTIRPRR